MTKSSSSDHHSDSPTGLIPSNRKHRSDRRPLRFWQPFNDWWRNELEVSGRRPTSEEISTWYQHNSRKVWGESAPSLNETRVHAKCLRSLPLVRNYFREYRAKKKTGQQGRGTADSQVVSVGHGSEGDQQPPAVRSQLSPSSFPPSISGQPTSTGAVEVPSALSLQQTLASLPSNSLSSVQLAALTARLGSAAALNPLALALSQPTALWHQLGLQSFTDVPTPDLTLALLLQQLPAYQQQQQANDRLRLVSETLHQQQLLQSVHNPQLNAAAAAAMAQMQAAQAQVRAQIPLPSDASYLSHQALSASLSPGVSAFPPASQPAADAPPQMPLRPTPRPLDALPFHGANASLINQLVADKRPNFPQTALQPQEQDADKLRQDLGQVSSSLLSAQKERIEQELQKRQVSNRLE